MAAHFREVPVMKDIDSIVGKQTVGINFLNLFLYKKLKKVIKDDYTKIRRSRRTMVK